MGATESVNVKCCEPTNGGRVWGKSNEDKKEDGVGISADFVYDLTSTRGYENQAQTSVIFAPVYWYD